MVSRILCVALVIVASVPAMAFAYGSEAFQGPMPDQAALNMPFAAPAMAAGYAPIGGPYVAPPRPMAGPPMCGPVCPPPCPPMCGPMCPPPCEMDSQCGFNPLSAVMGALAFPFKCIAGLFSKKGCEPPMCTPMEYMPMLPPQCGPVCPPPITKCKPAKARKAAYNQMPMPMPMMQ